MKGRNRKGKGGRLLQASTLSQLLVRPPNTTLEGNRHVRDVRQYSCREPNGGTGRRRGTGKGLGSTKTPELGPRDRRTTRASYARSTDRQWGLGAGFLTLSTCSRFSSLSWSWFLSHRAKSLSCVTAPRVSLSLAYSDFTCADTTSKEHRHWVSQCSWTVYPIWVHPNIWLSHYALLIFCLLGKLGWCHSLQIWGKSFSVSCMKDITLSGLPLPAATLKLHEKTLHSLHPLCSVLEKGQLSCSPHKTFAKASCLIWNMHSLHPC